MAPVTRSCCSSSSAPMAPPITWCMTPIQRPRWVSSPPTRQPNEHLRDVRQAGGTDAAAPRLLRRHHEVAARSGKRQGHAGADSHHGQRLGAKRPARGAGQAVADQRERSEGQGMKRTFKTAEDALRDFRRLVELEADAFELGRVFADLEESAPGELPRFRELLKEDIGAMKELIYKSSVRLARLN